MIAKRIRSRDHRNDMHRIASLFKSHLKNTEKKSWQMFGDKCLSKKIN
jgi:hypothetical protein